MKRAILAITAAVLLAAAAVLVPWQLGYDPSILAASSDYTVGWTTVKPAPVRAGTTATMETRIQARRAGAATIEATIRDGRGQTVWQRAWANQTFTAWGNRTLTDAWPVPAQQPAGTYTLVVRVLGGAAPGADARSASATVVSSRSASFTVKAPPSQPAPTSTPTPRPPAPTATATRPASSPTVTPQPPGAAWYPSIVGSATYVRNAKAAIDLLRTASPTDYTVVRTYVQEIQESNRNWNWGGSHGMEITAASMSSSPAFAASSILHEATHMKNWFTNSFPVFGCDGEAKSLRAQADFLRRIGQGSLAAYVEGFIGSWC